MTILTAMLFVAMIATVASLVAGVSTMATDSEVGHLNSAQWMNMRVGCHALALLLIVLVLIERFP